MFKARRDGMADSGTLSPLASQQYEEAANELSWRRFARDRDAARARIGGFPQSTVNNGAVDMFTGPEALPQPTGPSLFAPLREGAAGFARGTARLGSEIASANEAYGFAPIPQSAHEGAHRLSMLTDIAFPSPRQDAPFAQRAGSFLGEMAPGMLPMAAGPEVGVPAMAAAFGLSGLGRGMQEGQAAGASPEDQRRRSLGYGALGLASALVPGSTFAEAGVGLAPALARIGTAGAVGGAVMGGTQLAENKIAQETGSPERQLGEGVVPAALTGAAMGAGLHGISELGAAPDTIKLKAAADDAKQEQVIKEQQKAKLLDQQAQQQAAFEAAPTQVDAQQLVADADPEAQAQLQPLADARKADLTAEMAPQTEALMGGLDAAKAHLDDLPDNLLRSIAESEHADLTSRESAKELLSKRAAASEGQKAVAEAQAKAGIDPGVAVPPQEAAQVQPEIPAETPAVAPATPAATPISEEVPIEERHLDLETPVAEKAIERAKAARASIEARRASSDRAVPVKDDIADYATIAAEKISRGVTGKALADELVAEFGERVRPVAKDIEAQAATLTEAKAPEASQATSRSMPASEPVSMKPGQTFTITHGVSGPKKARYVEMKDGQHHYEYLAQDGSWKPEKRGDEAFARAASAGGGSVEHIARPKAAELPPEPRQPTGPVHPAAWRELLPSLGKKIGSLGKFGKQLEEIGLDIEYAQRVAKGEELGALTDAFKAAKKRENFKPVHFKYWNLITQKVDIPAERTRWAEAESVAKDANEKAHARAQIAFLDKAKKELGFNPAEFTPPDVEGFNAVWHARSDKYKAAHEAVAGEQAMGRLQNYAPSYPSDETRLSITGNDATAKGLKRRAERILKGAHPDWSTEQVEKAALDLLTQPDPFLRTGDRVPKPGSLERHRGDLFGPADIDQTFDVAGQWFRDAARSIRARELLGKLGPGGKKVETHPSAGLDALMGKLDDSLEEPKGIPFKWLRVRLRKAQMEQARFYGRLIMGLPEPSGTGADGIAGIAARGASSYQYGTKLTSASFLARNSLQPWALGPFVFDFSSTLRGALEQFNREKVRLNRTAIADHSHSVFEEHSNSPKSPAGKTWERVRPSRIVSGEEALNRSTSGSGASAWARTALSVIANRGETGPIGKAIQDVWHLSNPFGGWRNNGEGAAGMFRRRLKDIYRLTDAEIDEAIEQGGFDKVKDSKDPLKERSLDTRIRAIGSTEVNFGSGPNQVHGLLAGSGPIKTLVRTFQQFSVSAAHKFSRDVLKEVFGHGSLRPGLVGAAAWMVTGELGSLVNDLISGDKERKSDYADTAWGRILLRAQEDVSQAGVVSLLETVLNGHLPGSVHANSLKNSEDIGRALKQVMEGNGSEGLEYVNHWATKEIRAWRELSTARTRASQALKGSPVRVTDMNRVRQIAYLYRESFGAGRDDVKEPAQFKAHADLVRDAMVNVHDPMTGDEWDELQERVAKAVHYIASLDNDKLKSGADKPEAKKLREATDKLEQSLLAKGPLGPLSFASDDKKFQPKKAVDFYKWVNEKQKTHFGFGGTMDADKIKKLQEVYEESVKYALGDHHGKTRQ